jgi:hypothetical protein
MLACYTVYPFQINMLTNLPIVMTYSDRPSKNQQDHNNINITIIMSLLLLLLVWESVHMYTTNKYGWMTWSYDFTLQIATSWESQQYLTTALFIIHSVIIMETNNSPVTDLGAGEKCLQLSTPAPLVALHVLHNTMGCHGLISRLRALGNNHHIDSCFFMRKKLNFDTFQYFSTSKL